MNVMQKFHAAQVVVTVLEEGSKELKKARADGHVSLIEAVEIIYQVSRTAVQEAGLSDLVLFQTTRRGPRKPADESD